MLRRIIGISFVLNYRLSFVLNQTYLNLIESIEKYTNVYINKLVVSLNRLSIN
jgi:hypothetical protein